MTEGPRRGSGIALALAATVLATCVGCNSGSQTTVAPEAKLHATQNFSAAELNAPLSSKAKTSGAQVAPPPQR